MTLAFFVIFLALGIVIWINVRKNSDKTDEIYTENDVKSLIFIALRNNITRPISNNDDAKRIANAWVENSPPNFYHDGFGGSLIKTTPIGEALFILECRLLFNQGQPHKLYEEAALSFLMLLCQSEKLADRMTALDWECHRAAARALNDVRAGRES